MPKDGKKVAIGIGVVGLLIGAALALASMAEAKPPPKEYPCPYCDASFATLVELNEHIMSEHPGERLVAEITWE